MPKFQNTPLPTVVTSDVALKRGRVEIPLRVSRVSAQFFESLRDDVGVLKYPNIKRDPVHDPATGAAIKDKETGEWKTVISPESRKALEVFYRRYNALKLRDILRDSPGLEWDVQPPQTQELADWEQYADALVEEVYVAGGFTDEEITKLFDVADSLSCNIDIDKALEAF